MFNNIGGKIKKVAQIVCWIGIVASVISAFALMATDEELVGAGILVLIGGSLASWVGSFMVYGFGQLIENSDILVEQSKKQPVIQNEPNTTSNNGQHRWRCSKCGNMISEEICPICNKEKIASLNKWKEQGLITEEEYNQKMETLK